ncbi:MAG: hypothetical protein M3P06_19825 [Acidobacteriota bacterium]|nr:hypothetical protein [Acidobacteriota bacterium]
MTGPEDPINGLLEEMDRRTVGGKLIAAEHEHVAAASDFEILTRALVKKRRRVEVLDVGCGPRLVERLRHPNVLERRGAIGVAVAAQRVIDVAGRRSARDMYAHLRERIARHAQQQRNQHGKQTGHRVQSV